MEISFNTYVEIFTWIGFLLLIWLFRVLYLFANKQKGAAFAIGLFIQMFLPDPKVQQQTIEFIAEKKEKSGEAQRNKSLRVEND